MTSRTAAHPPASTFRPVASRMRPEHHVALAHSQACEMVGDWETAAERYVSIPFFTQSWHAHQLRVLESYDVHQPSWMLARWLTVMARRRPEREHWQHQAIRTGIGIGHPDGFDLDALGCTWPEQAPSRLWARDWAVRQLDVYTFDALRDLLREVDPWLVQQAGPVRGWLGASVRGYRVGEVDGESLMLQPAGGGADVRVLDLGLAEHAPGAFVLGRVVPVAVEPGLAFEWRPLTVDEPTAAAVCHDPTSWPHVLRSRIRAGQLPALTTYAADPALGADLPHQAWKGLVGLDLERPLERRAETLVDRAVDVAIGLAARGAEAVRPVRHQVAALLREPTLDNAGWARVATAQHLPAWKTLREVLPAHAHRRCEIMLTRCRAAARAAGSARPERRAIG